MPDCDLIAQPDTGSKFDERLSRCPPSSANDGATAPALPPDRYALKPLPRLAEFALAPLKISASPIACALTDTSALANLASRSGLDSPGGLEFRLSVVQ